MVWVESHQSLRTNPKTRRAARALAVTPITLIGHLHMLWWWALDHAEDGDLSAYDDEDIADAAEWDGDPSTFVKALVNCGPGGKVGFLERDGACGDPSEGRTGELVLHDWWDYAGRLVAMRRHNAGQKRKHREFYNDQALVDAVRARDGDMCRYCGKECNWKDRRGRNGGTYDYVDPNGPTTVDNVVVACRACNAGKGQRTPVEAGYELVPPKASQEPVDDPQKSTGDPQNTTTTKPNQTEPDQTEQNKTKVKSGRRAPARPLPPDWRPNDTHKRIAAEERVNLNRETLKFRDHAQANDKRQVDWDATFRTWLRRARDYGANGESAASARPQGRHVG